MAYKNPYEGFLHLKIEWFSQAILIFHFNLIKINVAD